MLQMVLFVIRSHINVGYFTDNFPSVTTWNKKLGSATTQVKSLT